MADQDNIPITSAGLSTGSGSSSRASRGADANGEASRGADASTVARDRSGAAFVGGLSSLKIAVVPTMVNQTYGVFTSGRAQSLGFGLFQA